MSNCNKSQSDLNGKPLLFTIDGWTFTSITVTKLFHQLFLTLFCVNLLIPAASTLKIALSLIKKNQSGWQQSIHKARSVTFITRGVSLDLNYTDFKSASDTEWDECSFCFFTVPGNIFFQFPFCMIVSVCCCYSSTAWSIMEKPVPLQLLQKKKKALS